MSNGVDHLCSQKSWGKLGKNHKECEELAVYYNINVT